MIQNDKNKPLIIYHGNCPDGFGAAWSFWRKYGYSADYFAANYGGDIPDITDRELYILDFSYSRKITEEIAAKAKSIVILDHHKTAYEALNGLSYFNYDVNHSGAYLSWKYLFGESKVPHLIKLIEDRDLWNFKIEDSKYLLDVLDSNPYDFNTWDMLARDFEPDSPNYNDLKKDGIAIGRYRLSLIEKILKNSHTITILGQDIPAINSPFFQSELGATLSVGRPYSCVYYWDGDRYRFSLRSDSNGEDVANIASNFGGGGHKRASGFLVKSLEELKWKS
jgi:oligoribonuclease NrnB/cAMP/cGMP phosphodiesterase (DHH superfamily)